MSAGAGALAAVGVLALVGEIGEGEVAARPTPMHAVTTTPMKFSRSTTTGPPVLDVHELALAGIARVQVDGPDGPRRASGLVLRDDGHVLTSAGVLGDAKVATVVLGNGVELRGLVLGTDPLDDLAVLRVSGSGLPGAVMGTADDLSAGDTAFSIDAGASPAVKPGITAAHVVAIAEPVPIDASTYLHGMITIDIGVPEGSHAAVLVDRTGAVIGLATTGLGATESGTTVVPVDYLRDIADDIIAMGRPRRAWLGVQGADAPDGGARVESVAPDSPAWRAGLRPGDVLVEVDGIPLDDMSQLVVDLRERDPGVTVDFAYWREGGMRRCRARLAELPPPAESP